jgi:hypothetical protein
MASDERELVCNRAALYKGILAMRRLVKSRLEAEARGDMR